MIIVAHRINTIEELSKLDPKYGVEIDIRGYGDQILLSHDPISNPNTLVSLEDYLKTFTIQGNSFIIFNIKEAGYEERVLNLAAHYDIPKENYFLLDVEFPYLYKATREGIRELAIRYSEAEPIENVESQIRDGKTLLDWVWIDTNTRLPLNEEIVHRLSLFKTALVSPDRWGRPQDIDAYAEEIKQLGMNLDLVMTSVETIPTWERHLV